LLSLTSDVQPDPRPNGCQVVNFNADPKHQFLFLMRLIVSFAAGHPRFISVDFERAIWNAIRMIVPGVKVCVAELIHFSGLYQIGAVTN